MKWWFKLFLCLLILGGSVAAAAALKALKKAPEATARTEDFPAVEVMEAEATEIELRLPSQGLVVPARETQLASEVAGSVIWVSPKFESGGEFATGEEMVKIDPADYDAALIQAKVELANARLNLKNEEAQAQRAVQDWEKLGQGGQPGHLVARKPQLESARARIEAAEANQAKARRDRERTVIVAPYDARIRNTTTELGSYLAPGGPIADLYSVAPYEIRLPLSLDDFALLARETGKRGPKAWLRCEAGGKLYRWDAEIIRREGEIDQKSRSVHLVAEIDPRGGDPGLLQPGLFMQAEVEGMSLKRCFRVPLRAFRDENRLVLVGADNRLKYRTVEVIRREGDEAFVASGLRNGDRICLTELEVVIDGMEVRPQGGAIQPHKEVPATGVTRSQVPAVDVVPKS